MRGGSGNGSDGSAEEEDYRPEETRMEVGETRRVHISARVEGMPQMPDVGVAEEPEAAPMGRERRYLGTHSYSSHYGT